MTFGCGTVTEDVLGPPPVDAGEADAGTGPDAGCTSCESDLDCSYWQYCDSS